MIVRNARKEEIEKVMDFYGEVIDALAGTEIRLGWARGVYPSYDLVNKSIQKKELFVAVDQEIAGAMVLNYDANEGYTKTHWKTDAAPDKTAVIHAFAISPRVRGTGVGKTMLKGVFKICKARGDEAIRLDVLARNIPAAQLYEAVGFSFVDTTKMYYEPIGEQEFRLYEYKLDR